MFNPHPFKGSFNDLADIALSLRHRVERLEVDNEKRKAFGEVKCTEYPKIDLGELITKAKLKMKEDEKRKALSDFNAWLICQPYLVIKNNDEYKSVWLASRGID